MGSSISGETSTALASALCVLPRSGPEENGKRVKSDRLHSLAALPAGKESLAILRAVAGIGRTLGITTTVEGVETADQLEIIKAEGFDEAQGYLFARPLPAPQLPELMQSWLDKTSP
nr:EAL domain-containing protein [Ensifer sp. BR816]